MSGSGQQREESENDRKDESLARKAIACGGMAVAPIISGNTVSNVRNIFP
jgi:hypothetical protein